MLLAALTQLSATFGHVLLHVAIAVLNSSCYCWQFVASFSRCFLVSHQVWLSVVHFSVAPRVVRTLAKHSLCGISLHDLASTTKYLLDIQV